MKSYDYMKEYETWSNDPYFADLHAELAGLKGNDAEIRERFYKNLDFGTAGIRGVMEAGTNRLNVFIVRKVSTAIARHIKNAGSAAMKRGVVIGYDSRINSLVFAKEAASVFAGFGIKTYFHPAICPVPVLSYSVRYLGTFMGIMITASHNPKEYNGYKVYGADGAQLSPEDSDMITKKIDAITDLRKLKIFDFDELLAAGKIEKCSEKLISDYLDTVKALLPSERDSLSAAGSLKVVYTPLHGAGACFVPEILKMTGVKNVYTVKEQMVPDGAFPTVRVPNPENADVYELAIRKAKRTGADLLIATDPDSDRTGACVRTKEGTYELLTGNEIGEILLSRRLALNTNKKPFVVSTLVSTRIASRMCRQAKVRYVDVLTGFKFIGEQILLREENGDEKFIFGFEESYGYLAGSYCRDKDAVASCMLLCEAAAYYKSRGMTLIDALDELYERVGAQHEIQTSLVLGGESGAKEIRRIMESVRAIGPDILGDEKPERYLDLLLGKKYINNGSGRFRSYAEKSFPVSDVLYYSYGDFWFCLRPSGTEPKIKVYFGSGGASRREAIENSFKLKERVMAAINAL